MEQLKKILASTKTTIVLSILFVIFFAIDFEIIASYLYGNDNPTNKGQLFGTTLTAIGGICVIWGLWLNNKKVAEQTRQNDISVQNSNDKRFGEAIGYLNDDNEGIAIGGIYALYQLAKEDERYAPIITNIFYNYVNDNTDKQDKKSYQTILSLLFSKNNPFVFDDRPEYSNIIFKDIKMYSEVSDLRFNNCILDNANIKGGEGIFLFDCTIKMSTFADFSNIRTLNGKFSNWVIISRNKSYINIVANELYNTHIIINDINFLRLSSKSFEDVNVHSNYIYDLRIGKSSPKCSLSKLSVYYVSDVVNQEIDDVDALNNGTIRFIKCDAMRSDNFYRRIAGFQD